MATSLTSPGLIFASDKAIIAARKSLEKLSAFTTDFSPDPAKFGSSEKIPVFSGAAQAFNGDDQNYNTSNGSVKWATVTFDTHKKCTFGLQDKDLLQVEAASIWANGGQAAGRAIGAALVEAAADLLTHESKAAAVSPWTTTLAKMAGLRAEAAAQGWDPANCAVILTPAHYATLLSLLPADTYGGKDAIASGFVQNLFGFKAVIEGTHISDVSSASNDNKGAGFLVPADALAVAVRTILPQEGTYVEAGTATDEVSGLTIGYRVTADQAKGELYWTAEALIGAALTKSGDNGAPGYLQLVTE